MTHNEYWKEVWDKAHDRLDSLLSQCHTSVAEVVGDENGIDDFADAKCVLAEVFSHCPNCKEKACAILSTGEALHALHELNENTTANAVK